MPLRHNPLDKLWLRQWKEDLGATAIACRNAKELLKSKPNARENRTTLVELGHADPVWLAYVEFVDALWNMVSRAPRYPNQLRNGDELSSSWSTKLQELAQVAQAPDGPDSLMLRDCLAEEKESVEELRNAAMKMAESAQYLLAQNSVWVAIQFVPRTLSGGPRASDPNAGSLVPPLTHVLSGEERESLSVADAGGDPDSNADAVLAGRSLLISAVARESPVSQFISVRLDPVPSFRTISGYDNTILVDYSMRMVALSPPFSIPSVSSISAKGPKDQMQEIKPFVRGAHARGMDPSIRSAFVELCREACDSLYCAATRSDIPEGSDESMTFDHAQSALTALTTAYEEVESGP
jgi:hypothetical protein